MQDLNYYLVVVGLFVLYFGGSWVWDKLEYKAIVKAMNLDWEVRRHVKN